MYNKTETLKKNKNSKNPRQIRWRVGSTSPLEPQVQFTGRMATYSGDGQNMCGNCTWGSNGDDDLSLYSKSLVLRICVEIPVLN